MSFMACSSLCSDSILCVNMLVEGSRFSRCSLAFIVIQTYYNSLVFGEV